MRVDVRATSERARANGTRERAQVEVTLHVRAQVLASRELVLAHVALERSKARVYAQVNVEVALIGERLGARQTRVYLGPRAAIGAVRCLHRVLSAWHAIHGLLLLIVRVVSARFHWRRVRTQVVATATATI